MPPSRLTASRPWALRNWATRAERAPTAQTQTTRSSTSSMRCISWSIGICTEPAIQPPAHSSSVRTSSSIQPSASRAATSPGWTVATSFANTLLTLIACPQWNRFSAGGHECQPNGLIYRSFVALCGETLASRAPSAPTDERHCLRHQLPAGFVVDAQGNPLFHRLALPGVERQPTAGRDQLRYPSGRQLDDEPVVDQHREDRLIDLDGVRPETAATLRDGHPADTGVLLAERLEQRCMTLVAGHHLLQQLGQPPIGKLLAAGLTGRTVLQRRICKGHLGDGVTTDIALLPGTPMHPQT